MCVHTVCHSTHPLGWPCVSSMEMLLAKQWPLNAVAIAYKMWHPNLIKPSAGAALSPGMPEWGQNNFNCRSKIWSNGRANRIYICVFAYRLGFSTATVFRSIFISISISIQLDIFINLHTNENLNYEWQPREAKRMCSLASPYPPPPSAHLIRCKKIKEFVYASICACVCVRTYALVSCIHLFSILNEMRSM